MLKTDTNKRLLRLLGAHIRTALILGVVSVFAISGLGQQMLVANADSLEEQVQALQQENRNNRLAIADLMDTATSYKNAIEQLQKQIAQLQSQINDNEQQKSQLEQQILEQQIELDKQKAVLGENIKAMYLDGGMSTIEMLATSKNLSEFVDKETYRNAVQSKIQKTMEKIAYLQNQLNEKKAKIEILLAALQKQRSAVNQSRAEQQRLLSMNEDQQAAFNKKTAQNQEKIDELNREIAAQLAANNNNIVPDGGLYFIRFPGSFHAFSPDNYPYKNAGFSMQPGACSFYDAWPDSPDAWGYCTRQCVSYAAWAVGASGRTIPRFYGSAKNWINAAPGGYIYRTPQPGDIAISTAGTWGHAMYVEKVSGNQIFVSQYNQQLTGRFSYQWRVWR